MSTSVKLVCIYSSSYTGTTWLNLVMASHPRAIYLGPYDQARKNLEDMQSSACLIHGSSCSLWPGFLEKYDRNRNFLVQLAEYTGNEYIVINNPILNGSEYAADITSGEVELIPIIVVRDLRAQYASRLRKYPQQDKVDVLNQYVRWCAAHPMQMIQRYPQASIIRYEEARDDVVQVLKRLEPQIGLAYDSSAAEHWEHDHHPVAGNHGPISFIAFAHGLEYPDFPGLDHYRKQFKAIREGQQSAFQDERWKKELSDEQKSMFDQLYGEINQKFGYKREKISTNAEKSSPLMYDWIYENWLDSLLQAGANFVTARDILDGNISQDRCNVMLRHDVDSCLYDWHVWPMLQVEAARGLRSTTYVFAQDPESMAVRSYHSPSQPFDPAELLFMQDLGFDFGLHVDVAGRCDTGDNETIREQAMKLMRHDLEDLQKLGLRISSMTAHGTMRSDGTRPKYDNRHAEIDYQNQKEHFTPCSEYYLPQKFFEKGGKKLGKVLPQETIERLVSAAGAQWFPDRMPAYFPFDDYTGQFLFLQDSSYLWNGISIKGLCRMLPNLAGCLVILLAHPWTYVKTNKGLRCNIKSVVLTDDEILEDYMSDKFQFKSANLPESELQQYPLDLNKAFKSSAGWYENYFNGAYQKFLQVIVSDWFYLNHNMRPSQLEIHKKIGESPLSFLVIEWLVQNISEKQRKKIRVCEVSQGIGMCSIILSKLGFPENGMVVAIRKNEMHYLQQAVSMSKIKAIVANNGKFDFKGTYDIFVAVNWDDGTCDHTSILTNAKRTITPGGLLIFSFVDESMINRFGWHHSPNPMLRAKARNAVSVEYIQYQLDKHQFKPKAMVAGRHPDSGFPEYVVIAQE
ncbi:MAG: hypothetical protein JRH09_18320 [Deltaproteobacteria bacterium]|nr:hypothetical protein [Deltaproteobacteria bacterium]